MLKEMPMASVLRSLGKMTADKVLEPGSSDVAAVCERIQSESALKKVRPICCPLLSNKWDSFTLSAVYISTCKDILMICCCCVSPSRQRFIPSVF